MKIRERNQGRWDIETSLVQDSLAGCWVAVVCRIHSQSDLAVWRVDEGTHAGHLIASYDKKVAMADCVLQSATGEVVDTDGMGLAGCWGHGTLPS
jgi:hypothetical protein